jgi:hypothetical protein
VQICFRRRAAVTKYFKYTVGDACESAVSTAPTLPLDFESSTIAYTFVDFDGGGNKNR